MMTLQPADFGFAAGEKNKIFPSNFLWGTATAAHEIEGDNTSNDWWDAEDKGLVPHKSGRACDSYNRYEEDFDLARAMHNNAHRFSIEWSRIEPREGRFNQEETEHYRMVLQALRVRGLEPLVTLHHFTNPSWFAKKGGWKNKKAPEYFARYVDYVAKHLGQEVTYWVTINEPTLVLSAGYLSGEFPPFRKRDFWSYFLSLQNMVAAHCTAYRILHRCNPHVQVGIAQNLHCFEPAGTSLLRLINSFLVLLRRYLINEWFLDRINTYQDFVGINYYFHNKVSLFCGVEEGLERNDFGWEIYPEGIYRVVKEAYERYGKPIYVTENGIADADDDQRPNFLRRNLTWLQKSIKEGADVRGYFYWTLLDNYEWAHGFTMRSGLVEVDFETFERTIRPSGMLYGEICKIMR